MDPILYWFEERFGEDSAYEVKTYRVDVKGREVQVELRDFGAGAEHNQFMAYARFVEVPEGMTLEMNTYGESLGNGDYTPQGALDNVHWNVFDFED